MGRRIGRPLMLLTGFALVIASCGDDTAETTTTTTTLPIETTTTVVETTTSTTTTTTLPPGGPPLIAEGDRNETVAAFQWLLVCGGHGTLTPDGNYGPTTGAVLQSALTVLGFAVPDEDAFAALSRNCSDDRPIAFDGDEPLIVFGNAAPGDPEVYTLPLEFDTALVVTVAPLDGVSLTLLDATDTPLEPQPDTTTWSIGATGAFSLVVTADLVPTTFTLNIEVGEDAAGVADWLITTTGITYKDTPKLAIGGSSPGIIDKIFEYLGHGVRGGEEFDTGWDSPSQPDVRGIAIEGFRFLFFGPEPGHLARIRVLAPTTDADGNPRPTFYVTTPQGIGPGHTRAQLLEVYPGLTSGKNSDGEYFYRLTNSGGELCFYFGTTQPTDTSPILELSTMCRA